MFHHRKHEKYNHKVVIYWLAEAWDNSNKHLIQTSWKKEWPSLMFEETPSSLASSSNDILQLVQEIPGYEDAGENCLQEWISCNDNGHQDITDETIVSMVQNQPDDNSEDRDSEGEDTPKNVLF